MTDDSPEQLVEADAAPVDPAEVGRREPALVQVANGWDMLVWDGTVLYCADDGQIAGGGEQGLFSADTRMLSTHLLTIEGAPWEVVSRVNPDNRSRTLMFQNPVFPGTLDRGDLIAALERRIDGGLHEDVRLESFAERPTRIRLRLELDADFADLFEVKKGHVRQREIERVVREDGLELRYQRGDFSRALEVRVRADSPCRVDEHGLTFDIELAHGGRWSYCLEFTPLIDGARPETQGEPHPARRTAAPLAPPGMTLVGTAPLAIAYEQGKVDLQSLAMRYRGSEPFAAAGAPWFLTVFGRDMLMAGLMSGLAAPWAAIGALDVLAPLQARERDDSLDAEPGKFPHELRLGEKARFGEIPHVPYYGAHDVPALYCLALWQAWRATGDRALLDRYLEHALAALRWCESLGDRDGDGLLEYASRSGDGYYNQSWKDAEEAVVHASGRKAPVPLATVELQGYWYAARLAGAELLRAAGRAPEAARLVEEARQLRALVEERNWMPDEQCYAIALDREKQQVRSVTSNPGHLLWCGLPSPERAAALARRLTEPDMFTGWGLRTLSSRNPSYNPLSYQNGSVWPHDTALAAAGLARYGLHAFAHTLTGGLVAISARMPEGRLPEVLAGTDRASHFLTPHPEANSPQAWGAAAALLLPQVLLGLVPDAPNGRCTLDPVLPDWLPRLEVCGVPVGGGEFSATVVRRGESTELEALDARGVEVTVGSARGAPLWGAVEPA